MTLRSLEIPARDWRVQLEQDLVLVPPDGAPVHVLRGDVARSVELMSLFGGQAALVVRPPGGRKIQFQLKPPERTALESWLGPPTPEQLRLVLRRRYAFALPFAIVLLLISLPLPGIPEENVAALPFDWASVILGVGLLVASLAARFKPTPLLFLVDSAWFGIAAAVHLGAIAVGSLSALWLPLPLFFGLFAMSGLKQFKQYRHLRATPARPEPVA